MMPDTLEPGLRLGKYEILEHIATGGMGAVYKAVDANLRRTVALKVLRGEVAKDDRFLERFRREARSTARLSHPNIVTLFEFGCDPEACLYYLVMELIEGSNLEDRITRKGRLPPEETRRILIQAAKALEHAFGQGIIHRDIKPSNFLLARGAGKTIVKLTDFGLALGGGDDEFKVTREGTTVGTIDYMAPEQARDSRSADIRTDIYALGCSAYHMLTGAPPFAEGGLGERLYKHLHAEPVDVRQASPTVSTGFWAILLKMLAKNPQDRYSTPTELLLELQQTPSEEVAEEECPTVVDVGPKRKTEHAPKNKSVADTVMDPPPPSAQPAQPAQPSSPLVSREQAKAAAAFHDRALEVLAEGGGTDYARQLLDNCLKQDPFNPAYRKTLREINGQASGGVLSRWFGSLNVLAIKSKLRLAKSVGDWRKVLEHGEEVLAAQPADADTHLEMVEAAEKLNVPQLATWLLEQGLAQAPESTTLLRAMARRYEHQREWKKALTFWEKVLEVEPNAQDAKQKINSLSVKDHIASSHYRR
jgi:serine/threonine protein kinase